MAIRINTNSFEINTYSVDFLGKRKVLESRMILILNNCSNFSHIIYRRCF